jgi:hypothetical protein
MDAIEIRQSRILSAAEVQAVAVEALGLDPELLDLQSPEGLAALVRRAASFSSPCPPRSLREAVLGSLRGLAESTPIDGDEPRVVIDLTIEALASYGDLLELPANDPSEEPSTRILYLAPPTYVHVDETLFLLGGALDGGDAVPADLRAAVEYRSHTRRICPGDTAHVADRLRAIGWTELHGNLWLPVPVSEAPEALVARANAALTAKPTTGEVPGLLVLDTDAPTTYYRGRWTESARKSGRFVARREQRYGADLWSYVDLADGVATHLVDFPLDARSEVRPCDEAWHLQMAIDMLAGHPQLYRRRSAPPAGSVLVDFFSPVPLWARRRWDVLGEETLSRGSLFAYRFPVEVFANVERTLHSDLWLAERSSS